MTTLTMASPPKTDDALIPYRLTVRQFDQMIGAGVFADDDRVELLEGILVKKMTIYAPHCFSVDVIAFLLRGLIEPRFVVREEKAVILGESWRPEPDVAVCQGPRERYRAAHPTVKDLALLVEVSDSSYPVDRGIKWRGYASAGIAVYWIVDLTRRSVEVYTDPTGQGETAEYRGFTSYGEGDSVPVVVEGVAPGTIAVKDILP